jgi:hypothetical protein
MASKVKLTEAELRALRSVADGNVRRVYRDDGNVYKGPSPSAVYWRLNRRCLIQDGRGSGVVEITCAVELSEEGRALLSSGKTGE